MTVQNNNVPLRALSAGIWGGTFAAAGDMLACRTFGAKSELNTSVLLNSSAYSIAIGVLTGLAVAMAVIAIWGASQILARKRRVSIGHPGILLTGTLAAVAFCYLNRHTFSGPGFQAYKYSEAIEAIFLGGGAIAALIAVRWFVPFWSLCSRLKGLKAWSMAAIFVGIGGVAYYLDRTFFPGLYFDLHRQLAIVTLASGAIVAHLIAPKLRYLLIPLLVVGYAIFARLDVGATPERAFVAMETTWASGWQSLVERGLARVLPPKAHHRKTPIASLQNQEELPEDVAKVSARLDELVPNRSELSLLLISVDTMRFDRLLKAGYKRDICPNFNQLADRAVFFSHCYSTYPTSAYTYSGLFTSLYASAAPYGKILKDFKHKIAPGTTMPDILRASGFKTAAETGFNRASISDRRLFGHLREGFEQFTVPKQWVARTGDQITDATIKRLEKMKHDRFFMWVHYMEPHAPYEKRQPFDFGDSAEDRYDSEIAWTDAQFGRLLKQLEDSGRDKNTAIVIMSDHGEEFRDHGGVRHGSSLYDEQVRVPLIISVPGMPAKEVSDAASTVDIFPTLMRLWGIDDPMQRHGRSLWPSVLLDDGKARGFAYAELFPGGLPGADRREMLVRSGIKLVRDPRGFEQIFDLTQDPGEQKNLVSEKQLTEHYQLLELARARANERPMAAAPNADESDDLEDTIESLRKRGIIERCDDFVTFSRSLMSHVYGIAPKYAAALNGNKRELMLNFIRDFWHPLEAWHGSLTMKLATALKATELKEWAAQQKATSSVVRAELAIFRASINDQRVTEELRTLYNTPGIPFKLRMGTALLNLGEKTPLDAARCLASMHGPTDSIPAIRALARHAPDELATMTRRMYLSSEWYQRPVRVAAAKGLGSIKKDSSGLARRSLALLAAAWDPEISKAAKEELAKLAKGAELESWLLGGAAEAEADEGYHKRNFCFGLLAKAQGHYPISFPDLALRMSRVRQSQQRIKDATNIPLAPGGKEHPEFQRYLSSIQNMRGSQDHVEGELSCVVESLSMDPKSTPRRRAFAVLKLKNARNVAWTGDCAYWKTSFELVCLDKEGTPLKTSPIWRVPIGPYDIAPGDSVRLVIPLRVPTETGTYSLAVRAYRTSMEGKNATEPVVIKTDHKLEVFRP